MEPSRGFDLQQMAYFMWEADGCPQDCGDRYWRKAVALDLERREREAAAALPPLEPSVEAAETASVDPSRGREPPEGPHDPPLSAHELSAADEAGPPSEVKTKHAAIVVEGSSDAFVPIDEPISADERSAGRAPGEARDLTRSFESNRVDVMDEAHAPNHVDAPSQADASIHAQHPDAARAPPLFDPTFGWLDLAQAQVACAVGGMSRLADCHTLGDIAASQSVFVKESIQIVVDHTLRLVDRAHDAIDVKRP